MNEDSRVITIQDFQSIELGNSRTIRVYLPRSYDTCIEMHYPVLYMHDGQNLFDPNDSIFKTSWNVDKTVDKLVMEGRMKEIIVVGIDNNINRSGEYCHFAAEGRTLGRMGFRKCEMNQEARGILYEAFILNSLKPYIDAHFRTLQDRDNTALMGSSLGGLVSYHIGFRHPEVFGMLGIVSPAFNWADFNKVLEVRKQPLKIWMDNGEGEAYYVENTRRVVNNLLEKGFVPGEDLVYYQVPDAIHNEESWAKRVCLPLLFFFGNLGRPVSCMLTGRNVIGIRGMEVTVNPIVQFDSGFVMTDINGKFIAENPDIMEIEANGRVIAKACGTTKITYDNYGVTDTAIYQVIDELSETVRIELDIKVPDDTPKQEKIFVHIGELLEAKEKENETYQCVIIVPRDWGYHFSVFMGDARIGEVDKNGHPIRSSVFKATDDMTIHHSVEKWAAV